MSEAVREENALMSYGFLFPKSLRRCRRLSDAFLFASDIGFPLSVGRMEVRPTSLRMAVFTPAIFPVDLLRGKKASNC